MNLNPRGAKHLQNFIIKMNITLSLNSEAINLYQKYGITVVPEVDYLDSRCLADSFINRGHNLRIVNPEDVFEKEQAIYSKKVFNFKSYEVFSEEKNCHLEGDVFFVYHLGEESGVDISKKFMNSLYTLEKQYKHVINSAESTSYEFKPKQKKLDLPWIPGFNIQSKKDLVSLIKASEKIIAKPCIGKASMDILLLEKSEDVNLVCQKGISNFLYEKFIPDNEERRYVFLDNQYIIGRKAIKGGLPAKEKIISIDIMEGNPNEIKIARDIVSKTGMFFCAVDFRGKYLLELNGSGTGMSPPSVGKQLDLYNLSGPVVMAVERYIKREKK